MEPELLELLGLGPDATLEDVIAAIKVLQEAAAPDEEAPTDEDDDDAPPDEDPKARAARAKRQAARALNTNTNNAILSAIKSLGKQISGVSARVDGDEASRIIAANIRKFNAKTEKQARTWPLATLRAFVRDADDLPENDEAPDGDGPRGTALLEADPKNIKLTAAELAVCKATSRAPAEMLKAKQDRAAAGKAGV